MQVMFNAEQTVSTFVFICHVMNQWLDVTAVHWNTLAHVVTQHYTLCAPKYPVPSVLQERGAADGLKPSNTS
jgi:hypothetical protein